MDKWDEREKVMDNPSASIERVVDACVEFLDMVEGLKKKYNS